MTAPLDLTPIRERAAKATEGPWAYESVSQKSNDYCVGVVLPLDDKDNIGDQISGDVERHPHYFNSETNKFGEWVRECVCVLDEGEHGGDGSIHADAAFIAHAREDVPALLAEVERLRVVLRRVVEHLEADGVLDDTDCVDTTPTEWALHFARAALGDAP